MINAEVLLRMKPGSYLINMARGGVVDEHALQQALTEGKTVRGAALDVHQSEKEGHVSPLASLPNVILTPHIGAQTIDSQREIGGRILEIMDSFAAYQLLYETKPALVRPQPYPKRLAAAVRGFDNDLDFAETIDLNLNAIKCFAF
jgi:phosphoglycerate dehydrogenase-like enzyme